jgi:hypothetical protein
MIVGLPDVTVAICIFKEYGITAILAEPLLSTGSSA